MGITLFAFFVEPLDEAIAGKCNVVCISKDERNRQPSIDEIKMAQYVFYRTFDVNTHAISDKLGEKIATIEVNFLLNKNVFKSLDSPTVDSDDVVVVLDASIDSQMVKDDKAAKSLSKKENCHPLENVSAAGPDITGPVVGLEEKLITEGPGGVNETVEYDGCVGSILVKEDKVSKGKDDAAGPSNLGSLVLPAAEVTMVSSKKIRSSSPDSKKNDVNEKGVVLPLDNRVTHKSKLGSSAHSLGQNAMNGPDSLEDSVPPLSFVDDKRSKLVNDNIKAVDAVAKANSDDNQLKKRKIAVTAPLCDNGGTSTPKRATVMSKTASKSVGTATEFNDISDGLSKKLKTDSLAGEKSNDKLREMSVKMSEDKKGSAAVSVAAIKPTQLARDDAEIGTSNGLSKKLKYNIKIENKSNDKNIKLEHKFNDKNVKVEQKFNGKNIKMEHKSNDELYKVLKEESKDAEIGARGHVTEVTQRPR
ncbi:Protein ANTI-SILENCING 1, partial [Bienertia sinuspersici]